jgi:hypothetical protein
MSIQEVNHFVTLYHDVHRLRDHIARTSFAERVAALRLIRAFIERERSTRDRAIAKAEATLPAARKAIDAARQALSDAQAAERAIIASIDRAKQQFGATAGVLELRAHDHHTPAELAAALVPADTAAVVA